MLTMPDHHSTILTNLAERSHLSLKTFSPDSTPNSLIPHSTRRAEKSSDLTPKVRYHTLIVESYHPSLSQSQYDQHILNAQRLRTLSFSQAFGVEFSGFHPSSDQPLDCDNFDTYCTHVLVYDNHQVDNMGQPLLVATTRLLDRHGAIRAGHFYSENEFKIESLLSQYPYNVLEMGRTCIHPHYRDVATIQQLWTAIGKVAKAYGVNAFMGCASIAMDAGSIGTEDIERWLDSQSLTIKLPIKSLHKLPRNSTTAQSQSTSHNKSTSLALPSLLKMYLRMGCSIGSQACYDSKFDCADIFIWLPFEQIRPRYQHYID